MREHEFPPLTAPGVASLRRGSDLVVERCWHASLLFPFPDESPGVRLCGWPISDDSPPGKLSVLSSVLHGRVSVGRIFSPAALKFVGPPGRDLPKAPFLAFPASQRATAGQTNRRPVSVRFCPVAIVIGPHTRSPELHPRRSSCATFSFRGTCKMILTACSGSGFAHLYVFVLPDVRGGEFWLTNGGYFFFVLLTSRSLQTFVNAYRLIITQPYHCG